MNTKSNQDNWRLLCKEMGEEEATKHLANALREAADQVEVMSDFKAEPMMTHDEYVAMKMLTRHKELRKEMPNKPQPDIEWMLGLLDVARHYDKKIIE